MKLYVDTNGKQVVSDEGPGREARRAERSPEDRAEHGSADVVDAGCSSWTTERRRVITVTTAGEKPNVKVGQVVAVSKLEACRGRPRAQRRAFRAEEIKAPEGSVRSRPATWSLPVMGVTWGCQFTSDA